MIQQINGTVPNDYFGRSLDLSHDGSLLTVSSSGGAVYMYELSSSTFLYKLLYTADNINAYEVSVSGDGMVVGITSRSIGARIFERIGDGFQERGTAISNYGYQSGIALNYAGNIAAIGDQVWSSYTGRAAVFQWKDDNENGLMQWMQMGSDITGDAASNYLGDWGCLSISHDGFAVAVGAQGYDKDEMTDMGLVRVYNYDSISDTWKQSGSDLVGNDKEDKFSKTAFSSDGAYLAVGAYNGNYIKVFAKNGNNYETVGDTIVGETEGDRFGFSVDMPADGAALAIGGYGFDSYKGKIYFYDAFLSSSPSSPTIDPTASSSLPPSFHKPSVRTRFPTFSPSLVTIVNQSATPSKDRSAVPSTSPSVTPSITPFSSPNVTPSSTPSITPFGAFAPSIIPTATPSSTPSIAPVRMLRKTPSLVPSIAPLEPTSVTPSIPQSMYPSFIPSTSPMKEPSTAPSSLTLVESSTIIFMTTTGVSVTDVTSNSLTALGAVTTDFFRNATDLTVTEVNIIVANLDANVIDNSGRFLQGDDSATFLFQIGTLSLATTAVYVFLVDYFMTNIVDFTILMRDSDKAFSQLIGLQINSAPSSYPSLLSSVIPSAKPMIDTESDVTSEPTKSPTVSPTVSHVPTISSMPSLDPTSNPASDPSSLPSKVRSDVPSQTPSLTPPITSTFLVPYERTTNSTTHNLTAVEAVLKEDDVSLLEYLSADEALLDEPFEVESVVSQVINADDTNVCFGSTYLCYTINTNVNVTRYPVTYSTNRSELIVFSSVLDFMEERDIPIVPDFFVPDNVESILSIVFGGVTVNEMDDVEVEAFEAATFDFLFDNLGQTLPPVLIEKVTFLSQSMSQPSIGDESFSVDNEEEPTEAELTVNFGVSGEYIPPPEIDFDVVLLEVFDEEGQDDYLEVLLASDNEYFNATPNLDILDVQVMGSAPDDRSSGSAFGLLGDEGGYSIIGVGCATVLLIVGMLVHEKHLRRSRTRQRNEFLKTRHLEARRLQNERFGVQDRDYAVVEEEVENIRSNSDSSIG